MTHLNLTHTRIVRACRRRAAQAPLSVAEQAEQDQLILMHAQQRRELEYLHEKLRRVGGYRMALTNELLSITATARRWQLLSTGVFCLLGGGYSLVLVSGFSQPVLMLLFAAMLLSFGCVWIRQFMTERPARVSSVLAAGDPMVAELTAWVETVRPEARRNHLFRELSALQGATVDVAPSFWDRFMNAVRRGA
ncbi:hypothetical protein [Leucobacter musarum]|uniref:hypothetical protein n=1 Tax=Leucobacter musarum TaxID=1930747 RepID=UPI0006A7D732|nr:hypothetical protein [Leucobacter musarum]